MAEPLDSRGNRSAQCLGAQLERISWAIVQVEARARSLRLSRAMLRRTVENRPQHEWFLSLVPHDDYRPNGQAWRSPSPLWSEADSRSGLSAGRRARPLNAARGVWADNRTFECERCKRLSALDMPRLIDKHGAGTMVRDLMYRADSTKCGGRKVRPLLRLPGLRGEQAWWPHEPRAGRCENSHQRNNLGVRVFNFEHMAEVVNGQNISPVCRPVLAASLAGSSVPRSLDGRGKPLDGACENGRQD